jgi:hypothetical protein
MATMKIRNKPSTPDQIRALPGDHPHREVAGGHQELREEAPVDFEAVLKRRRERQKAKAELAKETVHYPNAGVEAALLVPAPMSPEAGRLHLERVLSF